MSRFMISGNVQSVDLEARNVVAFAIAVFVAPQISTGHVERASSMLLAGIAIYP
jgi:hypothetical protein